VQDHPKQPQFPAMPEVNTANVTSAVGMEETVGRLRARRNSLFTHTVMWVTGLTCMALLLGTLAQAWSNSHLMQQVQVAQQQLQQLQDNHSRLTQQAAHYQNPAVIENEARQQLNYVRPGEQPVIVISSGHSSQQSSGQQKSSSSQQGFWLDWWNTFFGSL
jgi:cell division protein FtsB